MRGKTDEAVSCYFRLKQSHISPALEDGRRIHEEVEEHIKIHSAFPSYLPNLTLLKPETEKKVIVPYNELFDVCGVFDVLDQDTLYELKTGVSDSLEWAGTLQVPFYFMIASIAKIPLTRAYMIHYNQYEKTNDWCIIYNNYTAIKKAINLIDSVAPEIYTFFDKEGFI